MDDRTVLGRVLAVISVCLEQKDPITLGDLARGAGLPKPTVWRIAEDLTRRGLLQRVPDGYLGGPGLIELGNRAAGQQALRSIVTPELSELHARTGAAVWVVDTRSNTDWTLVGSLYDRRAAETKYAETWQHSPGDPAVLASALGVLALARRPHVAEQLLTRGVPRLTPHTEVNPDQILKAMERGLDNQEVVERESFRLGWSCLAVPVFERETRKIAAVVGVVDRTPRFNTRHLLNIAHTSAATLACHWPADSSA